MQAVRIDTTIDHAVVTALPGLRPMLGRQVELIALALEPAVATLEQHGKLTFEEFLTHRLKRPEGVPPVTIDDMEQAIAKGALDGNV